MSEIDRALEDDGLIMEPNFFVAMEGGGIISIHVLSSELGNWFSHCQRGR
jgi:hypothetical protein